MGDLDSIPELGRSPGAGPGNPLQYSCLGNPAEEPGGIQSVGSHGVRHNIATEPTRNNVQSRLPLSQTQKIEIIQTERKLKCKGDTEVGFAPVDICVLENQCAVQNHCLTTEVMRGNGIRGTPRHYHLKIR